MSVTGSVIMPPLCKVAVAIAPLPLCCCYCSSCSTASSLPRASAASGGFEIPDAVGFSSIGFRKPSAAAAFVVPGGSSPCAAVNVRARVPVECGTSTAGGNRLLVVRGVGKGRGLLDVRTDQGTRRRRIISSELVGMEDGGCRGEGRAFGDGDSCVGGGGNSDLGETKRNAHVNGLGVFSMEGYELTPPVIVEENSDSTLAESPVLNRLKKGFIRFKEEKFLKESELFSRLADGQKPKVMVIGCCDSRVDPTMLMELEPGEVFTLRNVANLVPPWEKEGTYHGTSAALEFAVMGLQVEHIIVLGHRHCGGIRALMTRSDFSSDFIGSWMKIGMSAREHTLKVMDGRSITDQCCFCEQESINVSLANLLTFSWIEDRVKQGKLGLHGWYYDFVDGSMISWEVKRQQYRPATHLSPAPMSTTGYH
ncbi:unnamed protein product [Sphagnum troendelagicum]